MKVLDPQAALLTTGEVHEFLKSSKLRPVDKKIGAYNTVNLHNYRVVKKDLDTYLTANTPYVSEQAPPEEWMKPLLQELKKYELTKTEAFSLINLGIGFNVSQSVPNVVDGVNGEEDVNGEDGGSEIKEEAADDTEDGDKADAEEAEENSLDRMLFGLVVEESDERFAGEEGEQRISEVLSILKETITAGKNGENDKITNGH